MPGRDLDGIHFAMEFLPQQNKVNAGDKIERQIRADGKDVIVIGGGDTGSDCVGTSNRHGAKSVTQFELLPMPPDQENKPLVWPYWPTKLRTSSSHEEGCEREFAIATKEFIGEGGKLSALKAVRVEWEGGKMVEVPGTEQIIPTQLVLLAMGFVSPLQSLLEAFGVERDARGNAKASTDALGGYATSVPQGLRRRRRAARSVAGRLGDPRRPPGGARGRRDAHGFERAASLSRWASLTRPRPRPAPPRTTSWSRSTMSSFGYDTSRTILNDVSLAFARGKVTAIMGGSGCGKTTLLRLIGGVLSGQQRRGHVRRPGRRPARSTSSCTRCAAGSGMLFQFGALFTDLSVFDNVAFPLREHTDLTEAMIRDIVLMKLNAVGLRGAAQPADLARSPGGMARRVALARAIALDPELIMYDEPFAGLDPISMGVAANLIRALNDTTGATSLIVSHDVNECFAISDYVYLMSSPGESSRTARQALADVARSGGAPVHPRRARRSGAVPLSRRGRSPRTSWGWRACHRRLTRCRRRPARDRAAARSSATARSSSSTSCALPGGAAPALPRDRADPRDRQLSR